VLLYFILSHVYITFLLAQDLGIMIKIFFFKVKPKSFNCDDG